MSITLDDQVMRGYLISLGFSEIQSSENIPTPDTHVELLPDSCFELGDYKTLKEVYPPNKKKIVLERQMTHSGKVLVETLIFSKKGITIGLTYGMDDTLSRIKPKVITNCNQEDLEELANSGLSKLPPNAKIQQQLSAIYQRLLEYAPQPKSSY